MIIYDGQYADEEQEDAEEKEIRESLADEAKYDMLHEDEEE